MEDHLFIAKSKMDKMHNGVSAQEIFGHLLIAVAEELRLIRKQIGYFLQHNEKNDDQAPEIS